MYNGIMATPKGTCWLLCTGPLTNAALLLSAHGDEICEHLKGLCFMGGAIALGNNNSSTEFNIAADPDAAKIVIETWGPQLKELVMVPLDVTMVALTNPMVRERIAAIGSTLSKTITELIQHLCDRYVDTEELQAFGDMFKGQCEVHDACAVLYIWRPDLFDARRMRVDVETASSFCYGTTCCDIYGRSTRDSNVMVCEKTNVPEFWENVIEALQQRSDVAEKKQEKQDKHKGLVIDTKKAKTVNKVTRKAIRKSPSPRSSTRLLAMK
jgi:inosine-uridine nucleoside N-ribohydrolase